MQTATLSAAAFLAGSAMATQCSKGLHIIVGRGTFEPPGPGETGALAKNISGTIPGSSIVAVNYPASLSKPNYDVSEKNGTQDVYDKVTKYHHECPGHKMAYLGGSQGAQIAVNAFCGGQGGIFGDNAPIPADAVEDVVAIAIFGDPSFNHSAPYTKGTSTTDGLFVRNSVGACANFTDKILSYCDTGDDVCSSGNNSKVHGMYLVNYAEQMQKFVVGRYDEAASSSTSGSSKTTTMVFASTTSSNSGSGSATSATSGTSATFTTGDNKNAAAGRLIGLKYAVLAALVATAQMLL